MSGNGLNVLRRRSGFHGRGASSPDVGQAQNDRPCAWHAGHASDRKKILVLSVSAGSGHVRAAEALCAHAQKDFADLALRHRDLMTLVPAWFRKIYTDCYLKLASGLPEAWGWLYRKTDHEPTNSLSGRLRRLVQRLCAQKLFAEIDDFSPDAIICTHFLPAELLADASDRGSLNCPVWVVVTDFDLHQMWVHHGITGYFVANEELAYRLQAAGIAESRIVVTGIPVMPAFTPTLARVHCSARFALDPQRTTVLMMGGGAGLGISKKLVAAILDIDPSLQLIVLTGRNRALFDELNSLACFCEARLAPVGFTDKVPELMACSDLVITKPGGLSTSECLVMGLPMLLVNPIPGQEERNAALLLQEGVAQRADDEATLLYRLRRLLTDAEILQSMRSRTPLLAQPHAAHLILQRVHRHLSLRQSV